MFLGMMGLSGLREGLIDGGVNGHIELGVDYLVQDRRAC